MNVASFLRVTALAAGALVATAPLASQDAPPRRLKVADTGLPGIDLGLAPLARLDAIGGRSRLRDREARPAPWVAGRVLVKFRDRGHAEAVAIDPSADAEAAARLYRARGEVEFAQPDYRALNRWRSTRQLTLGRRPASTVRAATWSSRSRTIARTTISTPTIRCSRTSGT